MEEITTDYQLLFDYLKCKQWHEMSDTNMLLSDWEDRDGDPCPEMYESSRPLWQPILYLEWSTAIGIKIDDIAKAIRVLQRAGYIEVKTGRVEVNVVNGQELRKKQKLFYKENFETVMLFYSLTTKGFKTRVPYIEGAK